MTPMDAQKKRAGMQARFAPFRTAKQTPGPTARAMGLPPNQSFTNIALCTLTLS